MALITTCESSLHPSILFLEHQFQYDSPVNVWVFQVVSFPHIFPTKQYTFLICTVRARCLAQLIVLGFITQFFNEYTNANHEAPDYAHFLQTPVISSDGGPDIFLSILFWKTHPLGLRD